MPKRAARAREGAVYDLKDWLILRLRHVEASANTVLINAVLVVRERSPGSRGPASMYHIQVLPAVHHVPKGRYAVRATWGSRSGDSHGLQAFSLGEIAI